MGKKILAVYFSQSGQLKKITENFCSALASAGHTVEYAEVKMQKTFPFPWTSAEFFSVMPESVLGVPSQAHVPPLQESKYDLIVFAYQPWYLSPSIPATSALHHPELKKRLAGTPVVTLIGSRNMWLTAQEKVKQLIHQAGAKLVGNVVLADRHPNMISAVTIQYWMFSGKKERLWGVFPKPGISDEDIAGVTRHGQVVAAAAENGNYDTLQKELIEKHAVEVKPNLVFIESRASRLFFIWARTIIRKKNRSLWIQLFKYYLLVALFLVAPLVLLINLIFFRPFSGSKIKRDKEYYSGVSS